MAAREPSYRLHKATGQAFVRIRGSDVYLGKHGTPRSRERYHRLIAEWRANGHRLPKSPEELSVAELVVAYLEWADDYYGESERENLKYALRPLVRLYGRTKASEFGPLAYRALRQSLVDGTAPGVRKPAARTHANKQMARVRGVFRWGVGRELIPPSVDQALQAVESLKAGRGSAREAKPVLPVPRKDVLAVLPHVSRQVAAMIEIQLATGARPGEICAMRPKDVDRSQQTWILRPQSHKTAHLGHARTIPLGPRAREALRPFLLREEDANCFSPAEAEAERRKLLHANRATPPHQGNRPGTNRKRKPKRQPGSAYTTDAYRRAIHRACKKAEVSRWSPHQIRHTVATEIRAAHGIEVAQNLLGHRMGSLVTEVYAERDLKAAQDLVERIG
ncbi:MAG: site-specific integrase [Myxococcota bacterium]